ncbi:protein kinase [Cryptosporidium ryanae]|uniref:protein kinase n=1 Tax=Cryptosporidium ryanae TaxID=515981 RepID=UPI00351AAB90|nr:protein kinase [Cryptosporidium ryanae]
MYTVHEGCSELSPENYGSSTERSTKIYNLRDRNLQNCNGKLGEDRKREKEKFIHEFRASCSGKGVFDLPRASEKYKEGGNELLVSRVERTRKTTSGNGGNTNISSISGEFDTAQYHKSAVLASYRDDDVKKLGDVSGFLDNGFSKMDNEELKTKKKTSFKKYEKEGELLLLEGKKGKDLTNTCVLNEINNKKINIGGFRDSEWYKKIPNWEKIIEERHSTVYRSYERLEMIGTGTYAKVWLLKDKVTGRKYAGKLLEPHTYPLDTVDRIERMFQSEIENLILSQCPGVVKLHKIVVGPEGSLLIQDYVDDGTIWRENCCVGEIEAFQHFIQLIQSVLFLQDRGVVHRDLKPTNILRYSDKKIVIGDFGWSERTNRLHLNPLEWPGTLEINPPEVLTFKGPLTEKIDNYAIGMNLLLFLTGRFICRQKGLDVTEAAPYILKVVELIRNDFNNKILSKSRHKCSNNNDNNSSSEFKQSQCFMWEMFIGFTDPNPETRWTIRKALFHPECIKQLLNCFNNNFSVIWHPQIISIIKSNIIPNSIPVSSFNLGNSQYQGNIFLEDQRNISKSDILRKNPSLGNIKILNQSNQSYVNLISGSVSSINNHGFINGLVGYDNIIGLNNNLSHDYHASIFNSDPDRVLFKQNQQQILSGGASLRPLNFTNTQKNVLKNDSFQPQIILTPNTNGIDGCLSTSSLCNGTLSQFRYQSTSSSFASGNNYLYSNQKQVGTDNTRQSSQYINKYLL